LLDASSSKVSEIAEVLSSIINDRAACRQALLRALRDKPRRSDFLVAGMAKIAAPEDEEAFRACYEADSLTENSLYADLWRKELIRAYPSRPEIRALALMELERRDGNIGAISQRYGADIHMCSRILKVIAPLPKGARLSLVNQLEIAASSSETAFQILDRARNDTDGTVCGEAIIGWTESSIANNSLEKTKIDYLVSELQAVGPEYDHRRAAAVIGLGLANNVATFAASRDHQGNPERINLGHAALINRDDRYLRRMLPLWDRFSVALGGDDEVLRRLELSAETCLGVLTPGIRNAEKLFNLLVETIPSSRHVHKHDHIAALARFAPESDAMRELIMPLLLTRGFIPGQGFTNVDVWAGMIAADLFAEHFADSPVLLRQVTDVFVTNPSMPFAASALAEVVLRQQDPELGEMLADRVAGEPYPMVSSFKLLAAVASGEEIVQQLLMLMSKDLSHTASWNCSYWVPSLLRRIEQEPEVAEKLIEAVPTTTSVSTRISFLALACRSGNGRLKYRQALIDEAERLSKETAPSVGFDVTSGSKRLAAHVIQELLV
jgi:hypothetical protein